MKLTSAERDILLRVRVAMRFRFDEFRPKPATPDQAKEEQAAVTRSMDIKRRRISKAIWDRLQKRNLVTGFPYRLTSLGWTALEQSFIACEPPQ